MTFAASIFLLALGAILRYALDVHVKGVSIDTVGLILMIAGAVGLVIALYQELVWSRRTRADEVAPAVEERREVREPPRY
jgi:hypothetical protein